MADKQTGVYIYNAFVSCGCNVSVVDPLIDVGRIIPEINCFNPDMLFCAREERILNEIIEVRRLYPDIITVCYNVDARHHAIEFGGTLLKLFDKFHIFYSKPKGMIEDYKNHCPNTIVKYLLEGIDPLEHKMEDISSEDEEKYGCDVSFMGTQSNVYKTPYGYGRIGLINFLLDKGVNIKLISYNEYGNDRFLKEDHNKQCQCSKIVLGHCGWADISLANSARDFRVTGAGGFLLTEHVKDIEEIFEIDKECVTYKDPQECYDKIIYYLNNEEERKKIAYNGYLRTQKDHTFKNRIEQVIDDVNNLIIKINKS